MLTFLLIPLSLPVGFLHHPSLLKLYHSELLTGAVSCLDFKLVLLKNFQLLHDIFLSLSRDEEMWQLQSLVSGPKVLEFKDNCLRVLLKAPILTSECVILGQKLDCVVDSSVSDHELLIEVDEGSMELNKVQVLS